jgi:serine-type D-Ala-D-Ala carboxypeptidase/endopeptidase (penicillin-binding protein 4)
VKTTFLTPSVRFCRISIVRLFVLFWSFSLAPSVIAQPIPPAAPIRAEKEIKALETLRKDIQDILQEPKTKDAYFGVVITALESGETLFELNGDKGFIPASNQKLLTAITALSTLGPEFRYTTELVTNGTVVGKTLKGDLIIRGSGDPTLGSPLMFPNYEPTFVFQQWADSLSKRGIDKIEGSVIADDSYFTRELYPEGWSYEDIPYGFAAPSAGLSFAENVISVSVSPNIRSGSKPFVAIIPETDYVEKTNFATTTTQDSLETISITRSLGTSTIVIRGNIKVGSPATLEQISVEEPALYAATTFRNVLELNGLTITGGTLGIDELREKIAYQKTKTLASFVSPPLSEIVKVMNKRSNNFYSEQLLRTVGKETSGKGNWEEGIQVMTNKLMSAGVGTDFLSIHDGSGMSRLDLLTPSSLIGLLRYVYRHPTTSKPFVESLPIMGVDGTLETRLTGTPAQGNVKAKTGSMTSVRSLSGYLTTKDGESLAFTLLTNNFSGLSKEVNNIHDLILLRLVNFSRK